MTSFKLSSSFWASLLAFSQSLISYTASQTWPFVTEYGLEQRSIADGPIAAARDAGFDIENLSGATSKNSADEDQFEQNQTACQLVQIVHLLRHPYCQTKAIASYACSGLCPSYVQMSTSKYWQHERSCTCCQHTGLREATFTLDCPSLDPPYKQVKTYAPVDCMCRACTDYGQEKVQPQELVDALASSNEPQNYASK